MCVFIHEILILFHDLYFFTYANTILSYVFIVSIENKWDKSSNYIVLYLITFWLSGSFAFSYRCYNQPIYSYNKPAHILTGIVLNLFGDKYHHNEFCLLIYAHGKTLLLLRSSLICRSSVWLFQVQSCCIYFINCIPKYLLILMLL